MRILVTGGWGYVGALVVQRLRGLGVDPAVCDAGWFLDARQTPPGAAARDLRDLSATDLAGFDAVIHLAALSNDPLGALDPAVTEALNHTATIALARRARAAGVGCFVFASTCSVYGASGTRRLDETVATQPITPYASAKRAAEGGLLALARPGFRVAILRGATAFGFSDCPRTDLLLNEFCARAALGLPLVLQSDGASWRPFMPVADFAHALVGAALEPPAEDDGLPVWNVAPPRLQMTVADAVRRAARATGAPPPVFGSAMPADRRSYRVDGRRFARAYPQIPYSTDFTACIGATLDGFRTLPRLAEDMATGRFVRLRMLDPARLDPVEAVAQARAG